jgi:3-oxoacyl-[acyl-carrier protein] reductase
MKRFEGKYGIVTGASGGLGRVIAMSFAEEGAVVGVGFNRSEEDAGKLIEEIKTNQGNAVAVKADIRNANEVDEAFKSFIDKFGRIDFLINNASIIEDNFLALMSFEQWNNVISTNLVGTFNCARAAVRNMLAHKSGSIINIGSVSSLKAIPGQANYAASKGGILSLTKTMSVELAASGIRVNAVIPGLFKDGMTRRLDQRHITEYLEKIPVGRLGNAGELANAVLFLASDEASYIVGQSLVVDGGLTI